MARNKTALSPAAGLFSTLNNPDQTITAPDINTIEKTNTLPMKESPMPLNRNLVIVPDKQEAKSKRKQILLQPSVHDQAEEKCKRLGISMNEVFNQLLKVWVEEDQTL